MKDCHIHMTLLNGQEDSPAVFLKETSKAGVFGGAVFSCPPESFQNNPVRSLQWKERLERICNALFFQGRHYV